MDVTYFGPSTDFIVQAFYDPIDDELDIGIHTNTSTMVAGTNPATGWEVIFTGTGLNANTLSGTITGLEIQDDTGNTVITFTDFAWPASTMIAAFIALIENDNPVPLRNLLSQQEINIDGSGAVDAIDGYIDMDSVTSNVDFIGTAFADLFESGEGDDGIQGGGGNDTLMGAGGNDTLLGGNGDDLLQGGAGNDSIVGGNGDDQMEGGSGNDTIVSGANNGNEVIVAGSGTDSVLLTGITQGSLDYVLLGHWDLNAGVSVTVDGNANTASVDKGINGTTTITDIRNPMLADGVGIFGTNHADSFNVTVADGGWMQVNGGQGADSYVINASGGSIRLDFRNGDATNGIVVDLSTGTVSDDGYGNSETISGSGAVWELRGTYHADMMTGSANDESFIGVGGDDTIDGGAGFDRVRYDTGSDVTGLVVNLSAGTASGSADGVAFTQTLSNIESVRGSNNNDTLTGSGGDDRLDGRNGNDRLTGAAGDDTVNGGSGVDRVDGGDGNDWVSGGDGNDLVLGGAGDDTMLGDAGRDRMVGDLGNDMMSGGTEQDTLLGHNGNDTMNGDAGDDVLRGGSDHDLEYGGDGNDIVIGGTGRDTLYGEADDDILRGNGGFDTVDGGDGNDFVAGGAQADLVLGGAGDDTVQGGGGFDTIDGGTGDDEMTGNFNADQFIFVDGHGNDTITDFEATNNAEKIDLSGISAITSLADLDLASAASGAATQVGADVVIDTGDGGSITLTGVSLSDLDANDFVF
ncbi:MAG: calcium-binding protein [Paracoccaceae bacterium]